MKLSAVASRRRLKRFASVILDHLSEEGKVEESWVLWESLLAEQICEPEVHFWWWPPWRR